MLFDEEDIRELNKKGKQVRSKGKNVFPKVEETKKPAKKPPEKPKELSIEEPSLEEKIAKIVSETTKQIAENIKPPEPQIVQLKPPERKKRSVKIRVTKWKKIGNDHRIQELSLDEK